jgi:hypothetical protein
LSNPRFITRNEARKVESKAPSKPQGLSSKLLSLMSIRTEKAKKLVAVKGTQRFSIQLGDLFALN